MSRSRVLHRVGWSLGDQVLSSLTNFALTISVARAVDPSSFGVFATLLVASQLVVVLSRGLASDPLTIRYSGFDGGTPRSAKRGTLGAAVAVGLVAAAVLCLAGLLLPPSAGTAALALAVVLPGLLVQDAVRFVAFTEGRPRRAFVNDLGWACLQIGGVAALTSAQASSAAAFILVWGLAGSVCGVLGLAQIGAMPGLRAGSDWLRTNWAVSRYYVAENALLNGTNLVSITLIGLVAGFAASASLRGAVALFGPMAVLTLGARAALTPEFVRLARRGRPQLYRASVLVSVAFLLVGVVWSGLILSLPDRIGTELLGETWTVTEPVLLLMVIDSTVSLFTVGAFVGIRASGQARRGLRARTLLVAPRLALGVGGAALYGAQGAAAAFACLAPAYIVVWSYQLRRAVLHDPWTGPGGNQASPQPGS